MSLGGGKTFCLLCVVLMTICLACIPIGSFAQETCNEGIGYTEIQGDFEALDLYGSQLLPPAQAQTTPQFLKIAGMVTFTLDYTFAPGSDIIFLDNNSGFRVEIGAELTLNSSHLRGCNKLWKGVEVRIQGSIIAQSSTFEDAITAILLRDRAEILIADNTFRANACGIYADRGNSIVAPMSIFLASSNGLSGNTFEGDTQLLESISPSSLPGAIGASPILSDFPFAGIWLQKVAALNIGNDSHAANVFRDFALSEVPQADGIRLHTSSATITNCSFLNFGVDNTNSALSNVEADCIYAYSLETVLPTVIVNNSSFENCYEDINTLGANLLVQDIISRRAVGSIRVRQANSSQNAFYCQIVNSQILDFKVRGIQLDLWKSVFLDISNNELSDRVDPLGPPRFGIIVRRSGSSPELINLSRGRVFNNDITMYAGLIGISFGIMLEDLSYLTVEQNTIQGVGAPSPISEFYGIRANQPCNGIRVLYNNFIGSGLGYTFACGIRWQESPNAIFQCNNVDNINTGIAFFGNCDNTHFYQNDFNNHDIGLALGHPQVSEPFNIMGNQINKENRWYGSSSNIEAYAKNLTSALTSVFEINSSNLGSFFWPDPRMIATTPDNFVWFVPASSGPEANEKVVACFLSEPPPLGEGRIAGTDSTILEGTYEAPFGYPALEWEARWQFADRLNRNPHLVDSSPETAQYFSDTYEETYSSLNRIYQAYLNRWNDAPSALQVAYLANSLNEAINNRFALQLLLSINPEENHAVQQQMLEADSLIVEWQAVLKTATDELNHQVALIVSDLKTELSAITVSEPYEIDMKSVLQVLLEFHNLDDELSDQQQLIIETIANKCRLSGGYAVVLARGFLNPDLEYPNDADCGIQPIQAPETSPEGSAYYSDKSDIKIFPNPATDLINVQIMQPFESGLAKVFNSQGGEVRAVNLIGQVSPLSVSGLPAGFYILHVQLDDERLMRQTFVVKP
jgi:hypothetical protein